MGFDYQSFLNDKIFEELNKIKAFSPEVVEQEAAARKKPGFPHDKLVFAAADHNARMINEYKGNPIGLSNRREYLSRLVRMLQSDQIESRRHRILLKIYLSSINCSGNVEKRRFWMGRCWLAL